MEGSPGGTECTVLWEKRQKAKSVSDYSSFGFLQAVSSSREHGLCSHHTATVTTQPSPVWPFWKDTCLTYRYKGKGWEKGRKEGQRDKGKRKLCLKHQVHYTAIISCGTGTGRSLCQTNLDPVNENYFLFTEPVPHVVFWVADEAFN